MEIVAGLIEALSNTHVTNDNKTFQENTTDEIANRDKQYSELLRHFVGITKVRNRLKELFKWMFFFVVVGSLVVLCVIVFALFISILNRGTVEQLISSIPLLTSAIVGLISAVIAVPITIAKYLFSKEEDNNITQIILHTQKHDTSGREWVQKYLNEANNHIDETDQNSDKDIS